MEIELVEIRDFLATCFPFDELPEDRLNELPRRLVVRYLRRGSAFPPDAADNEGLYLMRSGAVDLRDQDDQIRDRLGEGDIYRYVSGDSGDNGLQGVAIEDSLVYQLSCGELASLENSSEAFAERFSSSLKSRLKKALEGDQFTESHAGGLGVAIAKVIRREPVTIDCDASLQEAARLMTEEKISSLMIMANSNLAGLITDSDLRKQCVAEGVPISEPVHKIMRADPSTISYRATVAQALDKMTALRIRHLPVMKGSNPIGMISLTDIARYQSTNTAFLASDIRKAESIDVLESIAAKLPELQLQLSNAGATPRQIGHAITAVTDALTRRLLEMAEAELGPPPVSYAWMAAGSQGRQEQTSFSDQDNALLISDEMLPEHDEYFSALARIVSDGLNTCGFVYCPGDAMATNPQWRLKLSDWKDSFSEWIDHPNPKAMMQASIFFDLRVIEGKSELFQSLQDHILAKTREDSIFLAHLAVNVLTHRPPLGFFRNFVLVHDGEHDDTLDLKHRGSVPIIDIARLAVLAEGLQATNTIERLALTSGSPSMSSKMGDDLMHALTYIDTLRIRHQADLIRQGLPPNNYLRPADLSGLERSHLKDAFRIIQVMQETLELRYQTTRLS